MTIKNEIKKPRGRPRGSSGSTIRAVTVITNELARSLDILKTDHNTTLAELLAIEFQESPSRVLTAVSRYLPKEINVAVGPSNPFLEAIQEINTNIIDITPSEVKKD